MTMADGKASDILSWWKQRDHSLPADPQTNRPEGLPRLARMARQYHNEPSTSAGAERLFSAASRAHHDLTRAPCLTTHWSTSSWRLPTLTELLGTNWGLRGEAEYS